MELLLYWNCRILFPGTWSTTGLPPCIECDIGYYEESYGSVSCSKCPGNKMTLLECRSDVSECFGKKLLLIVKRSIWEKEICFWDAVHGI